MDVQIVTLCDSPHGTFQHALMLARALSRISLFVQIVGVTRQPIASSIQQVAQAVGISLTSTAPEQITAKSLNIVVGFWDHGIAEAATRLMRQQVRLILVPTTYWQENLLPGFEGPAEALWYVSWDQVMCAKPFWFLAKQVNVGHLD